ncbi:LytR/AlgR family response regulator transcription factor [Aquimarina sp. 2201CG14-23]|uniref:LytR/AlgR family response regulator transcription factor n=1 Tax=Aquimarina mycalae TaxID=3040073 RepID=UPI0024782090|nr:LytTR family DNA-binding domain-containing protein [Aquimarina sp. 2201CG14-23]MDH7447803.1 LytTR family DNA-binding domain-containing protein [Aquimarina sp. 2201CG14-23]
MAVPFYFKQANRFLPHIVFVGLGIGTANYIINEDLNWIQWIIQSVSTSFFIGYTLIIIGLNKSWFKDYFKTKAKLYIFISLAFFLVGALASEIEHMIRSLIFHSQQYQPWSSGKMYLFNGIISLVLGYSFFKYDFQKSKNFKSVENQKTLQSQKNRTDTFLDSKDAITSIPVRQGENILLIPIGDIIYFEAFDNYSFVYNLSGEKKLCDYSLLFLEKRLNKNFSRVHRKYIVNKSHIKQIKPHFNGRYLIEFYNGLDPISSSKGYSAIIRKLIKIE